MKSLAVIAGACILAGTLLIPRRAAAMTSYEEQDTSDVYRPEVDAVIESTPEPAAIPDWGIPQAIVEDTPAPGYVSYEDGWIPQDNGGYIPYEDGWVPQDTYTPPWEDGWVPQSPNGGNVATDQERIQAFLYMIRCCEHVYPRDVTNGACYGIFYAGISSFNSPEFLNQTFFSNMSDHPVITGACRAVPLPPNFCKAAGLNSGCVSTAAGAYQIIKPQWLAGKNAIGLADFTPANQDAWVIWKLGQIGALDHIIAGRLDSALAAASRTWASLPGSLAQQGPKKMAYAVDRFNEGLSIQVA